LHQRLKRDAVRARDAAERIPGLDRVLIEEITLGGERMGDVGRWGRTY
jgi:hypothetical protein